MVKLTDIYRTVDELRTILDRNGIAILSRDEWADAKNSESGLERKSAIFYQLRKDRAGLLETHQTDLVRQKDLLLQYQEQRRQLEQEIRDLKNKKLTYPDNTIRLRQAIAQEFLNRGIHSEPRIFSDLLEITDPKWQNAAEGYLNTQRFYLLVEPQYYAIALSVYDRIKRDVHSVGLVNTEKLPINDIVDQGSLAYVVSSENRWA
jgi:Fe-S cluster biosynthesis and repair protein YggX